MKRWIGSIACVVAILGASASAGQGISTFDETVEVRLVEIEVGVSDRKQRPVDDLALEDFELLIDGKPRKIDSFTAADRPAPVADSPTVVETSAEPSTEPVLPEAPLFLAVYVDRSFLEAGDFDETRRVLPDLLQETLRPSDQVLLATSGEDLEILVPFDSDRRLFLSELTSLEGSGLGGKLASDARLLMQEMRRMTQIDGQRRARQEIYLPLLSRIESYYGDSLSDMFRTTLYLSRLIDSLAGLPGRKQVLYVGGPIPSAQAKQLFEVWRDTFERSVDDNDLFDPSEAVREVRRYATQSLARNKDFAAGSEVFGKLAQAAAESGIVFHTLGLENLRRSSSFFASRADVAIGTHGLTAVSPDVSADARATLQMDDGLRSLSGQTGGVHFVGRRKIDRFLDRVGHHLTQRYVLRFYAEPSAEPYRIKVRLKDRKKNRRLDLRYRTAAAVRPAGQELGQRTLSALVTRSAMDNPLGARVVVDSIEEREKDWQITLSVDVPVSKVTLLDGGDELTGHLWVYAAAGRPGKEPSPVMRAPIRLSFPAGQKDTINDRRAEYQLAISAPKGSTRLAVSVRDDYGPTESTLAVELAEPKGTVSAEKAP